MKIVPKYKQKQKMKPNPQIVSYWEAFNAGREHERKIAIEYFIGKIEELHKIPGIGPKTFEAIMEFVNKEWGE